MFQSLCSSSLWFHFPRDTKRTIPRFSRFSEKFGCKHHREKRATRNTVAAEGSTQRIREFSLKIRRLSHPLTNGTSIIILATSRTYRWHFAGVVRVNIAISASFGVAGIPTLRARFHGTITWNMVGKKVTRYSESR